MPCSNSHIRWAPLSDPPPATHRSGPPRRRVKSCFEWLGQNAAAQIGRENSSTRSFMQGIPSGLCLPSPFGMNTRRTGRGRYVPFLTLNQGPFPPPALPGFAGTAGLSATQAARPVPRGRPVEGHAPSPHGLPVLRSISVYRHAVVNTPVARWVGSLVGRPIPTVSLLASGYGLPQTRAGSAHTLDFSRPAQRSLALRPACSLHR